MASLTVISGESINHQLELKEWFLINSIANMGDAFDNTEIENVTSNGKSGKKTASTISRDHLLSNMHGINDWETVR